MAMMASAAVVDPDGRGVYVGGLPKHAEWQELKDHFKQLVAAGERCHITSMGEPRIAGFMLVKLRHLTS